MANPQKSAFSFDQPSSGASGTSLFGQPSTSSQPSSGGIFGSASSFPASASGGGLFGSTNATTSGGGGGGGMFGSGTATSGSSVFGGGTGGAGGGSSMFGGTDKPASGGFNFVQASSANPPGTGLFGSTPASSQTSQFGNTATSSAPSIFATPSKPTDASKNQNQTPNPPFGGTDNKGGSSLFQNLGASTTSTTTPTSKPTSSFFGNSTTPAGPPPNTSVGASSSNAFSFGQTQGQDKPSLFGNATQPSNNAQSNATNTTAATASLFDSSSKGGSNLFGNQASAQQGGGLFQNLNQQQGTNSDNKAKTTQSSAQTAAPSIAAQSTGASMFSNTSTAPSFNFAKNSAPASSTPAGSASGTSGFPILGQSATASSSATPTSNAPTSNFFNLGNTQNTSAAPSATPTSSAAPSSNFFNIGKSSPPESTAKMSTAPVTDTAKPAVTDANKATNMSASTAGPPPPAQSRLKNKSMDDIITRWATDLSKYQKEFQAQAEKVARWDRMLVENSEKIQKLYGQTLDAERATTEVERQLSAVENDQAELESWLNHYEKEVDSMIKQQGDGEAATGPDAERQRTYQLAGRLSEKLDEMGKDLTSMIEEINDASSNLSKNSKKDDPLSQVVRVLNSHLHQLQQIDQGASALSQKVQEAQRAARTMRPSIGNGSLIGGANSEAADGFFRSYMGRR